MRPTGCFVDQCWRSVGKVIRYRSESRDTLYAHSRSRGMLARRRPSQERAPRRGRRLGEPGRGEDELAPRAGLNEGGPMPEPLSQRIALHVAEASQLYHRLVLVVGTFQTGKTTAFRELEAERGWPLLNLNLSLSERLLELTTRQRALRMPRLLDDLVAEVGAEVILLDNLEMLFHPELQQDPLRLLQGLSRNRTVVASWRGHQEGRALQYASPEHPEYRRYDSPQALLVAAIEPNFRSSPSTQDRSS
jgi:hypothetical protein